MLCCLVCVTDSELCFAEQGKAHSFRLDKQALEATTTRQLQVKSVMLLGCKVQVQGLRFRVRYVRVQGSGLGMKPECKHNSSSRRLAMLLGCQVQVLGLRFRVKFEAQV